MLTQLVLSLLLMSIGLSLFFGMHLQMLRFYRGNQHRTLTFYQDGERKLRQLYPATKGTR